MIKSILSIISFPIVAIFILQLIPFKQCSVPILCWFFIFIVLLSIEGLLIIDFAKKLPIQKRS